MQGKACDDHNLSSGVRCDDNGLDFRQDNRVWIRYLFPFITLFKVYDCGKNYNYLIF